MSRSHALHALLALLAAPATLALVALSGCDDSEPRFRPATASDEDRREGEPNAGDRPTERIEAAADPHAADPHARPGPAAPPQPAGIPAPPDVAAAPPDAQRTASGLASKVIRP